MATDITSNFIQNYPNFQHSPTSPSTTKKLIYISFIFINFFPALNNWIGKISEKWKYCRKIDILKMLLKNFIFPVQWNHIIIIFEGYGIDNYDNDFPQSLLLLTLSSLECLVIWFAKLLNDPINYHFPSDKRKIHVFNSAELKKGR
jgi:hypothetical protein